MQGKGVSQPLGTASLHREWGEQPGKAALVIPKAPRRVSLQTMTDLPSADPDFLLPPPPVVVLQWGMLRCPPWCQLNCATLGMGGKEEGKSAWNGVCASLGAVSESASPLCLCALHAAPGPKPAFCHQSPGPEALIHSSPAKKKKKILLISPLSLLKHPLFCSARFHGFPVAVGLFAWIEVEDSGSLLLEEGG